MAEVTKATAVTTGGGPPDVSNLPATATRDLSPTTLVVAGARVRGGRCRADGKPDRGGLECRAGAGQCGRTDVAFLSGPDAILGFISLTIYPKKSTPTP